MFGRTGLDNGTQWFPSDPNVVPLRSFHRLTSRNGGISVVKPCFDCCCCCYCCCCWWIIIPAVVDDDDGDDDCCFAAVDDILLLITLGGWLHSTTATIHPFDAATQYARGGNTGRVADIAKSTSSISSVVWCVAYKIRVYRKKVY